MSEISDSMAAIWESDAAPNVMFIKRRLLMRLARGFMTRRGFRRWRGRRKARRAP